MNMNMKEAEIWVNSIIPKNIEFSIDFTRWHYKSDGKIRDDAIETIRTVWIGGCIKKHITHNNWKAVVDGIYDLFSGNNNDIDLGFEED